MASNPQDFTLYSTYWDAQQPTYNDSNLMGYPTAEAYTNGIINGYTLGPESFEQQQELQHGSPAKADLYYEYQPPVLSSTSDSGASVQSAMSSHTGSPSAQAQPMGDWNQHFSMLPGIVHNDNGFPTSGMDMGPIPIMESKGCVGEFTTISSFRDMTFSAPHARISTEESRAGPGTTSLDSHTPTNYQAFGGQSFPETGEAPRSATPTGYADGMSFRSPTTPASSHFPYYSRSPVLERVRGQRRPSSTPSPKRSTGRRRLARSCDASDDAECMYAPPSPTQSHFFSQSSGHFVPPLESSCPSPLLYFLFLSFFAITEGIHSYAD